MAIREVRMAQLTAKKRQQENQARCERCEQLQRSVAKLEAKVHKLAEQLEEAQ